MTDDLPEHLRETRDLLMRSAPRGSGESPPPPPQDLIDDLEARLGGVASTPARAPQPAAPRVGWLRRFLASPAFGVAAALILLVGIAIPLLDSPPAGQGTETFRGGSAAAATQVHLILVGSEAATLDPKLFDPAALTRADTAPAPESDPFPRVVVDFTHGEIVSYDTDGREVDRLALPEDPAELAEAIARAIGTVTPE